MLWFPQEEMPVSGQKGNSQCCEPWSRQAGNTSPVFVWNESRGKAKQGSGFGQSLVCLVPRESLAASPGSRAVRWGSISAGAAGTSGSRHLACGCSPCVRFGACLEKCAARTITPRTGEGRAGRARWLRKLAKGKYFSLYILANTFFLAPKFTAAFAFLS